MLTIENTLSYTITQETYLSKLSQGLQKGVIFIATVKVASLISARKLLVWDQL